MEQFTDVKDILLKNTIIRTFDKDFNDSSWHRDAYFQTIEMLNENNWKIQYENMLPMSLVGKICIRKNESYRFIKGSSAFKVRIIKN